MSSPLTRIHSHPLPTSCIPDGETDALALPASIHIGDDVAGLPGVLHVTTRRLVWLGTGDAASRGYAVPFRSLTMHAVSRDATDGGFSKPCIYAQIEGPPPHDATETSGEAPTTACDEDEREEEQDTFDEMTEARFAPDDSARLDELFRALCDCAALNPDDDADDDDDVYDGGLGGGAGDFYYDEDEVARGRAPQEGWKRSIGSMPCFAWRGRCPSISRRTRGGSRMTKRKKMTHRWGMRARRMERGVASREAKAERKRAQSHFRACTPDPPPSARVARSAGKWGSATGI